MSFLFSSKPKPAKPTPGFHPIELPEDPKPREYAPEEVEAAIRLQAGIRMIRARRTAQGLRGAKIQHAAAVSLQAFFRGGATRSAMPELKKKALEEKATRYTAAQRIQEQFRKTHPPEPSDEPQDEGDGALPPAEAFTIRNLDTGEAVSLELGKSDGDGAVEVVSGQVVSFGTLQQNPQAWEALKSDSKGLLEKLASSTTVSFRSYQLCVWQERYVYASDDALCYQHLSSDMQPTGSVKQIPYSSIEFVGARFPCALSGARGGRLWPGAPCNRPTSPLSRAPAPQARSTSSSSCSSARGGRTPSCATTSRRARAGLKTSRCSRAAPRRLRCATRRRRWGTDTGVAVLVWVGRATWLGRSEGGGRASSRRTCVSLLHALCSHPIGRWSCWAALLSRCLCGSHVDGEC